MLVRLIEDNESQLHALEDLDELLSEALTFDCADRAETLGFALRGFFETLRRTLTWELDIVWPMAKRILTPMDARELQGNTITQTKLN